MRMRYFQTPKPGRNAFYYVRKVPEHLRHLDINPGGKSNRKRIEVSLGNDETKARVKWEEQNKTYDELFQRWENLNNKHSGSSNLDLATQAAAIVERFGFGGNDAAITFKEWLEDNFLGRVDVRRLYDPTEAEQEEDRRNEEYASEGYTAVSRYPEIKDLKDKEADLIDLVRGAASGNKKYLTLAGAFARFLKDKRKPNPRAKERYDRNYKIALRDALAALDRDPLLAELTYDDAKTIQEYLEKRAIKNKSSTIKKKIGHLQTVFEHAATVHGFKDRRNPFANVEIINTDSDSRIDGRQAMPMWLHKKCIKHFVKRELPQDDAMNTYLLLSLTGCRCNEIAQLLKKEVILDAEIPFIRLRYRRHGRVTDRELKNSTSVRDIPLVPHAVEVIEKQLTYAGIKHGALFRWVGQDNSNASNSINHKVIHRYRKGDERLVLSGLRHLMTNRLRKVEGRLDIRNAILGRPIGIGLDAQYGGVTLEEKYEALLKATEPMTEATKEFFP